MEGDVKDPAIGSVRERSRLQRRGCWWSNETVSSCDLL